MTKKLLLIFVLLVAFVLVGCTVTQDTNDDGTPISQDKCGDGVCDGPENQENCPQDCTESGILIQQQQNSEDSETNEDNPAQEGYRFVSFSGTVHTTYNTEDMDDFSGRVVEYSGEYVVKLWFPLAGGEAVKQENTITLTDYRDRLVNADGCETCEWVIDPVSLEPYSFELSATLTLDSIREGDTTKDELTYQLLQVPTTMVTGQVTCCGDPGPINDPAVYPALLGWFLLGVTNPIQLNVLETNEVENFLISPVYSINIPRETLSYTMVDSLTTP